jgi:ubiquinol-cytochrome c reductase cytochrome b subunit
LVLAAVALLHLFYLHSNGSSTSFFFESRKITSNPTTFYPYFFVKDLVGLTLLLMVYIYFIAFKPDALGHSDNYIPASSLVTPEHIVPE